MSNLPQDQSWEPLPPPSDDNLYNEVDPRVDATHAIGALPCPNNPPPPDGWAYWNGAVTVAATSLAKTMLYDSVTYPMGSFVQTWLEDGTLFGARVEWHTFQGTTGKAGCFRGVSVMQRSATSQGETTPPTRPASTTGLTLGVDSAEPVTKQAVALAKQLLGQAPAFWGRYFTNTNTVGTIEYRHGKESAFLRAEGIRLLPIARQTGHVGGSEDDGERDGRANAADLVATFGHEYLVAQGGEFFLFLDVETGGQAPALSADYYRGWCKGLASVAPAIKIRPCVYANQADRRTWKALNDAAATGTPCHGLWVAHWSEPSIPFPKPDPAVSAPVLLWQYAGNCQGKLDCNRMNPSLAPEKNLLQYLIPIV